MRIAVAGSSGLIGGGLLDALRERGEDVSRLVRGSRSETSNARERQIEWDPYSTTIDPSELKGLDVVVNLGGVGIGDRRWSAVRKRAILESRTAPTRSLCSSLAAVSPRPRLVVNASAIGFYGDRGDEVLTEQSAPGSGFTAEVCTAWEAATAPAEEAGIRVVHLRSAVVLAKRGGTLARLLPLFRMGLGGRLGTGEQWFSWITLRDEVAAILRVIDDDSIAGAVNACSPNPVTNSQFTRALGRAVHRPTPARVPRAVLRAAMGRGLADELALASQRVVPERLVSTGFQFTDGGIDEALRSVLSAP